MSSIEKIRTKSILYKNAYEKGNLLSFVCCYSDDKLMTEDEEK